MYFRKYKEYFLTSLIRPGAAETECCQKLVHQLEQKLQGSLFFQLLPFYWDILTEN